MNYRLHLQPVARRTPWTVCADCGTVIDSLDRCSCDYKRVPSEAEILEAAYQSVKGRCEQVYTVEELAAIVREVPGVETLNEAFLY